MIASRAMGSVGGWLAVWLVAQVTPVAGTRSGSSTPASTAAPAVASAQTAQARWRGDRPTVCTAPVGTESVWDRSLSRARARWCLAVADRLRPPAAARDAELDRGRALREEDLGPLADDQVYAPYTKPLRALAAFRGGALQEASAMVEEIRRTDPAMLAAPTLTLMHARLRARAKDWSLASTLYRSLILGGELHGEDADAARFEAAWVEMASGGAAGAAAAVLLLRDGARVAGSRFADGYAASLELASSRAGELSHHLSIAGPQAASQGAPPKPGVSRTLDPIVAASLSLLALDDELALLRALTNGDRRAAFRAYLERSPSGPWSEHARVMLREPSREVALRKPVSPSGARP